jgi:uncharacterized protein (DUF2252 family)
MLLIPEYRSETDRRNAFAELARRVAADEPFPHPLNLPEDQRRLYVRRTLREDHRFRIRNRPEGAQCKFDKLAGCATSFFRGTALLFYRDMVGSDADLPRVFSIGDVHPENFGVMPNADGVPFFGVNDFDEAEVAPFSWDLKRGATGFYLYAKANGFKRKHRRKVLHTFAQGYLDALADFARDDREKHHQYRLDNSPRLIRKLLKGAIETRRTFLAEKVDLEAGRFRPSDELVPVSSRAGEFQRAVKAYAKANSIDNRSGRAGHFRVKDVAVKKGSGTASLGLDRYWVLIDGETDDHGDDILLEFKQARRSALWGLSPPSLASGSNTSDKPAKPSQQKRRGSQAERISNSHRVHLASGDPYYGHAKVEQSDFIVRERSPFKDDIDVDELDVKEMRDYAKVCGGALAQAHARADKDTGLGESEAERSILESVQHAVFVDDVCRFAVIAAHRVERDHALFCADHALGAFQITAGAGD